MRPFPTEFNAVEITNITLRKKCCQESVSSCSFTVYFQHRKEIVSTDELSARMPCSILSHYCTQQTDQREQSPAYPCFLAVTCVLKLGNTTCTYFRCSLPKIQMFIMYVYMYNRFISQLLESLTNQQNPQAI